MATVGNGVKRRRKRCPTCGKVWGKQRRERMAREAGGTDRLEEALAREVLRRFVARE
jgi:hypothetical protein